MGGRMKVRYLYFLHRTSDEDLEHNVRLINKTFGDLGFSNVKELVGLMEKDSLTNYKDIIVMVCL